MSVDIAPIIIICSLSPPTLEGYSLIGNNWSPRPRSIGISISIKSQALDVLRSILSIESCYPPNAYIQLLLEIKTPGANLACIISGIVIHFKLLTSNF